MKDMPGTQIETPISPSESTMGVVLSGGAGKRFGGLDKGLEIFNGKHLVQAVLDSILPQVNSGLICINRNEDQYRRFNLPCVYDESAEFEGPVAGIVAAIRHITNDAQLSHIDSIVLSSCDSPRLPADHVLKLARSMTQEKGLSALVHDGDRKQNLHSLIHRNAWNSIEDFFTNGGRAMHRWHKQVGSVEVDFSDQADRFLNINSIDGLS